MINPLNLIEFARSAFPPSLYNGLTDATGEVRIDNLKDFLIILSNLIQMLVSITAVLAIIFIVWSGIQYITSSGDPGKTKEARNGLTNAIVGVIIASGAYAIVEFFARQF